MRMKRSRLDGLIMEQEGLPSLTRGDLEDIQLCRLNALLSREKERNGFYRSLPDHLTSLEELRDLPFTTEEDLALRAGAMLLISQAGVKRVLSDATSGTTGTAKRVFYSEADLENTVRLYMAGLGELIFPGSVTMICFPFSGPFGLGELISEAVSRLGARPLRLGPDLTYGEYRSVFRAEQPDSFVGMPVQLLSLLRACGRGSLRRALVSGDACPEPILSACEELLGSRLWPHYGSREMGMAGAVTCPAHRGMHLRENHIIAEIVDPAGHVLPYGEYGELVITTVGMEALPLIRYRTGDYTRILPGPCPCGSVTLRLDSIQRGEEESLAARLDGALFQLLELVDYRIDRTESGLAMYALTTHDPPGLQMKDELRDVLLQFFPQENIRIQLSPAGESDRALLRGKRRINV